MSHDVAAGTAVAAACEHRSRGAALRRRLCRRRLVVFLLMLSCLALRAAAASAYQFPLLEAQAPRPPAAPPDDAVPAAPERVEIRPEARDEEIQQRLQDIITATGWFRRARVEVTDGVVFLYGAAETAEHRRWAGDLARSTQAVAAVVNNIEVLEPAIWDFDPATDGLRDLWHDVIRSLPFLAFGLIILAVALLVARLVAASARASLRSRLQNQLLRNVIARGFALLVFLLGLYVVFQLAGLSAVAFTLLGGTGVLGIILGIALRDITENVLASILLSIQPPFRKDDLVEVEGIAGYVQQLTIRTTVLMTLDGNHVQIPNSTVYKSVIRNYTSNPNRREEFVVGIGYNDSIAQAQETALAVLAGHPAVLKDPEPWVLADSLGKSVVYLRVYFWLDGRAHSWLKVRSSVIRLVKRAFQATGISMPDEAREIVFPEGVPVRMLAQPAATREAPAPPAPAEPATSATGAEHGLSSDAADIKSQASRSRPPEEGATLLKSD